MPRFLSHIVIDRTTMTSIPYHLAIEIGDGKDEILGITNQITVTISKPAPPLPP